MGKLSSFQFITLNGFFKGPDNDVSWHRHGGEESEYANEGLQSNSTLLFGRITYEMMAGWWPTPEALKNMPEVAEGMNKADKIVFSKTLKKAEWNNTRIIKNNMEAEIKKLKQDGKDMTILGSGSILTQLAEAGLIDTYQIMLDPVALGSGTPLLQGLKHKLDLQLVQTRTFKSGVILLTYEPLKK